MPDERDATQHSDDHDQSATPPHGDPLAPDAPAGGVPGEHPQERPQDETATPPHGDPLGD